MVRKPGRMKWSSRDELLAEWRSGRQQAVRGSEIDGTNRKRREVGLLPLTS